MKTTMSITVPTGKAGKQKVFNIEFNVSDFDLVLDAVSGINSLSDIQNPLWVVL